MEPQYDERFTELRKRFAARSVENATRLETLVGGLSDDASGDTLHEIEQIAHRLVGAAGTFGFPALGALADGVEQEASYLRASGSRDFSRLADACRRLKEGLKEFGEHEP